MRRWRLSPRLACNQLPEAWYVLDKAIWKTFDSVHLLVPRRLSADRELHLHRSHPRGKHCEAIVLPNQIEG